MLIRLFVDDALASFIEFPFIIDCLPGRLDNGFQFTAFACYRMKMENRLSEGRSVFSFQAHAMIKGVGINNPDGTNLYRVQFAIADILPWGGLSGYSISDNHTITGGNTVDKLIFENDQIGIHYRVFSSFLPVVQQELLVDRITLTQRGVIEIQSKEEEQLGFFEDYYKKIKSLMEISVQREIKLTDVTGWSHSVFNVIGEERIERPIPIMIEGLCVTNQNSSKRSDSWKWITLQELLESNSFSLYIGKYDILEPIVELYMETFNPNGISSRRLFLNTIQGLETYHSRFIAKTTSEFTERINDMTQRLQSEQLKEQYKTFLMAKTRNHITLESRLADLLIANFETVFDTGDISVFDFPGILANTRNYLIHYNEEIKKKGRVLTGEEMDIYNRTLLIILEYYLLREIGFSDMHTIKIKSNNRWGSVSSRLSILKASKEKHDSQEVKL